MLNESTNSTQYANSALRNIFTKKKNMTPIEYREYISQMLIKY